MGASHTSLRALAAMEAALYEGSQLDPVGTRRSTRLEVVSQWSRPMVKLGSATYDQAMPKKLWDRLGLVSILDTINRLSPIT